MEKVLGFKKLFIKGSVVTLALLALQIGCSKKNDNGTAAPTGTASGTLALTPSTATVGVNSTTTFSASGGTAPYNFYLVSGSGSINQTTGVYTAPAVAGTAQIDVVDATNAVAFANITVSTTITSSGLAISPTNITLNVGTSFTFTATGGTPPFQYHLVSGGGAIDLNSGIYVAPVTPGNAQVNVVDASNNVSLANIVITNSLTPSGTTVEIYRYYNGTLQDHLYSLSQTEGQSWGFGLEGAAFQVYLDSSVSGTVALYRCRTNTIPQRHFLSVDYWCEGQISPNEGILGYIYPNFVAGLQPLFRFVSQNGHDHLETLDYGEGTSAGFKFQGILGYVFNP